MTKKDKEDCTWKNGKAYYGNAIKDFEEAAKCLGTDEFLANSTVATVDRVAAEDKVREEMVTKMGETFDVQTSAQKGTVTASIHGIQTRATNNKSYGIQLN